MHGSDAVFLDLREDKYLSMDAAKVMNVLALPQIAEGSRAGGTLSPEEAAAERSAQVLLKRGLLTIDRSQGKGVEFARVDEPQTDLIGVAPPIDPQVRVVDVLHFLSATVLGWTALRFGSLERIVERAIARRKQHPVGAITLNLEHAKTCISRFERMRPFLFSARDACLFESLVLTNFLAKYGLYPVWVFAVRTEPFAAHCWLQWDRVAFNDHAEHASEFTPIMVI